MSKRNGKLLLSLLMGDGRFQCSWKYRYGIGIDGDEIEREERGRRREEGRKGCCLAVVK
jgi:hypothetical protein